MIIDCISDLHGHYPNLEGGDLLIVAGDLTAHDTEDEHQDFREWIADKKYLCKIFIGGNHDNYLRESWPYPSGVNFRTGTYLCDSDTEFEGLKIWGSPWTKTFEGMNPKCKAFTCATEEELAEKWLTCPNDVDIMITHSPALGILDEVLTYPEGRCSSALYSNVGSESLLLAIDKIKPKILVCGHVHECGGSTEIYGETLVINASHVNEKYRPVNKAIRLCYEEGQWKEI